MSVSILIYAILVRSSINKVPKVWWKSKIVKRLYCDFAITVEYMVLGADSAQQPAKASSNVTHLKIFLS